MQRRRARTIQQILTGSAPTAGDAAPPDSSARKAGWVSVGGILAALGAATYCVLPFALVMLGAGSAWIRNLRPLEPYTPIFAAFTFVFLGCGFCLAYRKPKVACAEGADCAKPGSGRPTQIGLWTLAVLVAIALGLPKLAPLFL